MQQRVFFFSFLVIAVMAIAIPSFYLLHAEQAAAQTSDILRDQNLGGSLAVADVPITIVTTYNAVAGRNPADNTEWPRLAIFVNNGGGFQGLNDTADCTKADRPANCGTPNLFADRMIDDFAAVGNGSKSTTVSARRLLFQTGTNEYVTKLSFAYYNDFWDPGTNPVTDRDVFIRQVDFKGPDGTVILSYKPDSTSANFYFNMGVLNMEGTVTSQQNGMNRAFDKGPWLNPTTGIQVEEELIFDHNHPNFNSTAENRWSLKREGSFNIVTRELATKLIEKYPGGGTGGGGGDVSLTIRSHYQAVGGFNGADNSTWPRIALFINNGANFDGTTIPDSENCAAPTSTSTGCGTAPAFTNKRIDEFEVNTATFVRNSAVLASSLVMPISGQSSEVSKLSFVYHNDFWNPGLNIDRNVYLTKVEILGPDGVKFKEFVPPRTAIPSTTGRADGYYFNMGLVTLEDMRAAFDRELLFSENQTDQNLFTDTRWQLEKEGSFNIVSFDLARIVKERYLDTDQDLPNSCVLSTNSTGGTLVKPGLPLSLGSDLIISSRASSTVKEFSYAFYNRGNLNTSGAPQPYCVTGVPATPGVCPEGSGHLIIKTTNTGGPLTAFDATQGFPSDSILTSIRGGAAFSKTGANNWTTFGSISRLPITQKGEVQAFSAIVLGERLFITAWIDNAMYRSTMSSAGYGAQDPLLKSQNVADYRWEKVFDLAANSDQLPGTGPAQAFGEFTMGTNLVQVYWRGNQEYMRLIPVGSGSMPGFSTLDTQQNAGFTATRTTANLPGGSGSVNALTFLSAGTNQVTEVLWRANTQYSRVISMTNFNTAWTSVTYNTDGPAALGGDAYGSGIVVSQNQLSLPDLHPAWVAQKGSNQPPTSLQIAATFLTTADTQIGPNDLCTSTVLLSGQLAGDLNKDCRVNIFDYNFAIENLNRQCQAGQDCVRTTQDDIDRVIANFGNKCQ